MDEKAERKLIFAAAVVEKIHIIREKSVALLAVMVLSLKQEVTNIVVKLKLNIPILQLENINFLLFLIKSFF